MKKINDIEYFLNLIKEISLNDIDINDNLVYANLTCLNIKKESINYYFPEWIEKYKYKNDITVFIPSNWTYFCLFKGYNSKTPGYNKIKLYVPLDKKHIYEGVNLIIDFLREEKIPHESKTCSHIRNDDFIIRLDNKTDAEKVKNFISDNKYIKEGLISANPFAVNEDDISFTWDGNISYNALISGYISDYINTRKKDNELDKVSYEDFYSFILKEYDDVFNKGYRINEFINKRDIKDAKKELINFEASTKILLYSLDKSSNLDGLYKKLKEVTNPEYEMLISNKISLLLKRKVEVKELTPQEYEDFDSILFKLTKYKDKEYAINVLKHFSKNNNDRIFTRTNNIRNDLISSSLDNNKIAKILRELQIESLINAVEYTKEKYGNTQAFYAIKTAKEGDFHGFTNTLNSRDELKLLVDKDEIDILINKIVYDYGYEITDTNDMYNIFIQIISNDKIK